jgi:hypothetical protein
MNQDLEDQAARALLQASPTDSPQLALAKNMAKLIVRQHGAEAAGPAIEYARCLSAGVRGRSHAHNSQPQPRVLGATRR